MQEFLDRYLAIRLQRIEVDQKLINEVAPELSEEVAPAQIEEVAPELSEEVAPELSDEVAPALIEEVAPALIEEVAPELVEEVAPELSSRSFQISLVEVALWSCSKSCFRSRVTGFRKIIQLTGFEHALC